MPVIADPKDVHSLSLVVNPQSCAQSSKVALDGLWAESQLRSGCLVRSPTDVTCEDFELAARGQQVAIQNRWESSCLTAWPHLAILLAQMTRG